MLKPILVRTQHKSFVGPSIADIAARDRRRLLLTQDPSNVCAVLLCKKDVHNLFILFLFVVAVFLFCHAKVKSQRPFSIQGILSCVKSFSCVSNFRHRCIERGGSKYFADELNCKFIHLALQKVLYMIPFLFQLIWHVQPN